MFARFNHGVPKQLGIQPILQKREPLGAVYTCESLSPNECPPDPAGIEPTGRHRICGRVIRTHVCDRT